MAHKRAALCWLSIAAALSPPTARVFNLHSATLACSRAQRVAAMAKRRLRIAGVPLEMCTRCRGGPLSHSPHSARASAADRAMPWPHATRMVDEAVLQRASGPNYVPGLAGRAMALQRHLRDSTSEPEDSSSCVAETDCQATKLSCTLGDVGRKTEFDLNFVRRGKHRGLRQ